MPSKDKPKGKTSMKEFASDFKSTRTKSGLFIPEKESVEPITLDSNFDNDKELREKYNKELVTLDKDYTNFIPNRKILVRCKVLEYEITESGLAIKPSVEIAIGTQNGYGIHSTQESPYPYSVEAVVVSVPEGYEKYKPGDSIVIPKGHTLAGRENIEVPFHMPRAFTLPVWKQLEPPTNIENKHYGYLLIENVDILGKLK